MEQTEALARAFLAAVEARHRILPLERDGFEGRAIVAARLDIELIASTLEGVLRATDVASWADDLRHHLTVVAWFASLAAPDAQADVAEAGNAALTMLATIDSVLAIHADAIELGGAGVSRAA